MCLHTNTTNPDAYDVYSAVNINAKETLHNTRHTALETKTTDITYSLSNTTVANNFKVNGNTILGNSLSDIVSCSGNLDCQNFNTTNLTAQQCEAWELESNSVFSSWSHKYKFEWWANIVADWASNKWVPNLVHI